MRILHTSDWHIGRNLHNASLLEDQRHVLRQILAIVEAEQVDVVVIAGDVYDRSVPPAEAVTLLDEIMDELNGRLGVPVIMIAGNHDGPERMAFGASQMAGSGLHIFGPLAPALEPVVLSDQHGEVAFYGLPYADPARVRDVMNADVHTHQAAIELLTGMIRDHNTAGRRVVVLGHCFLEGGDESESERPLSVGGVDRVAPELFSPFDYVALGHLHAPQHRHAPHIRYSGSILKYSFSEARQRKCVTLVTMDAAGGCDIAEIPLEPLRDLRVIEGYLQNILDGAARDPNADDYLLVRLLDAHAILDVMGKLRAVYPNVLHLERPALAVGGERESVSRDRLERGLMPMFLDFYRQMRGDDLDSAGREIVAALIDQMHREEVLSP